MNMSNAEVAKILRQVAAVYAIEGDDAFRVSAYTNAANSIESSEESVHDLWESGKLDTIPGIGEKLTQHLDELFRTGKVKHFDELFAKVPGGIFPLLDIPGIGPKTALKLANTYHLHDESTALTKLEKLGREGELDEKTLKGMERLRTQTQQRILLSTALRISSEITDFLKKNRDVIEAEAMGSIRRRTETIGDIDIGVSTLWPGRVTKYLKTFPKVKRVVSMGERLLRLDHKSGLQIDVRLHEPKAWGSLLQHYTGSKAHNIALRSLAMKRGLSLSEYGFKKGRGVILCPRERDVYDNLGLRFIPPEIRENIGEIEAAEKGEISPLVELKHIRGDFHIHTNLEFPSSHDTGVSSVRELLEKATHLKYSYIGFSDHNPKQSGLSDDERLKAVQKHRAQLEKAAENFPRIKVYFGLEVDILPDGDLAVGDDILNVLDYAIVSIHSVFSQDEEKTTARILKALEHPKAKILGHPTGRIIQTRDEIDADWSEIFSYCSKHKKLVEINATPTRLDLPPELIREARKQNVKFIINTDSHSSDNMDFMQYGVFAARRGWCSKKDIVNCSPSFSLQ
ncbi:MAG TPA: PHP domain-containing protein [Patescibacteria group bacterium]|nr:PHP domain-containing protein [Patescibacteria group bacterium]